jgi:hypothetical protein
LHRARAQGNLLVADEIIEQHVDNRRRERETQVKEKHSPRSLDYQVC